jgi:hypothetical protein
MIMWIKREKFHGVEKLVAWFGWQSCVTCAARLSARSTRLGRHVSQKTGWPLDPGGDSGFCNDRRGLWAVYPMQLGSIAGVRVVQHRGSSVSGVMSGRRPERWYWRSARRDGTVDEGGWGGGGVALKLWQCLGLLRGLASSSKFKRPIYAPPIGVTTFSLQRRWMVFSSW